ncbi:hypothetical protein CU097_006223, partial [Rhizopus azygosporus]
MPESVYGVPSTAMPSSRRQFRRNSAPGIDDSTFRPFSSPIPSPTTSAAKKTHQHRLNAAQEQRTYRDSCNRLLSHITSVVGICDDLKKANKDKYPMFYPMTRPSKIT